MSGRGRGGRARRIPVTNTRFLTSPGSGEGRQVANYNRRNQSRFSDSMEYRTGKPTRGGGGGFQKRGGRGQSRGRGGRGGNRNNRGNKKPEASEDSLDDDLDKYMGRTEQNAANRLDSDLDAYMANRSAGSEENKA